MVWDDNKDVPVTNCNYKLSQISSSEVLAPGTLLLFALFLVH